MKLPASEFSAKFWRQGLLPAGIDEAGRGALAGPVVAAAVILPQYFENNAGISDSKVLSEKKRNELFDIICQSALSYAVAIVDNQEIDRINVLQATLLAMNAAVNRLNIKPDHLLVDGNRFSGSDIEWTTIVRGDALCISIAAASVIAKVTRDRIMANELDKIYPEYGFAQNKGYGAKKHLSAIEKHGVCDVHRITFLKKFFAKKLQQKLVF